MEVTKRVEFECCYICDRHIEAHHCKLEVTVEGPQRFNDFGRVIKYEDLTRYMKYVVPDKSFIFCDTDPDGVLVSKAFIDVGCTALGYEFEISAENLCKHFADTLQDLFDKKEPGIQIIDLKLREDNNSFVSWKRGS